MDPGGKTRQEKNLSSFTSYIPSMVKAHTSYIAARTRLFGQLKQKDALFGAVVVSTLLALLYATPAAQSEVLSQRRVVTSIRLSVPPPPTPMVGLIPAQTGPLGGLHLHLTSEGNSTSDR